MKFNFIDCENIDEDYYEKAILKYLTDHFYHKNYNRFMKLAKLTINIYPVGHKKDNPLFYQHSFIDEKRNFSMPHGNTGIDVVNVFIFDTNNYRHTLMNFSVISHELAHAIIMIVKSDNFVSFVHFQQEKNKFRSMWFWHKKIPRLLRVLDITVKTNLRNKNKGF